MPFTIRDIPAAMRREHWEMGARLMERWFDAPAWTMSGPIKLGHAPLPARAEETKLVQMSWLLRFARVAAANNHLLQSWSQPPRLSKGAEQVRAQLTAWLLKQPTAPDAPFRFGDFSRPVPEINERYAINFEVVDSPWYRETDDFYAAFGKALLKLAVSGMVERVGPNWRVTIDQVGTFLRDTYDFNGDQPLGSWGPTGFSKEAVLAEQIEIDPKASPGWWTRQLACYSVSNGTFASIAIDLGAGAIS